MKLVPTYEQRQAQEAYLTGESLAVEALAGSGKTTLMRMLVELGSPRGGRILYTSFGRKAVADAKAKFPASCKVATNHSLAFPVGARYQNEGRLQGRINVASLVRHMGWTEQMFAPTARLLAGAHAVIETLNAYCQSADPEPCAEHATDPALRLARGDAAAAGRMIPLLVGLAHRVWDEAMRPGGVLPVTHDMYLKLWALGRPRLPFATILTDEAQDSSALMVGLLQEQTHAQLVVVGDSRQAIYGFRGAVDSLRMFQTVHRTTLTQSFRFGPKIAETANAVLLDQCNSDILLRGDPNQPGMVAPCDRPACVLARTNATLVGELFDEIERNPGGRMAVVGGVSDLLDLIDGAGALQAGMPTGHPDLAQFGSWGEVEDASNEDAYAHLRNLVKLVSEYGVPSLRAQLNAIRGNENDLERCDTAFSTAHKAKGAEFRSVRLANDFVVKGPEGNPEIFGWTPEEGNLLYVACTRARQHLDVYSCESVMQSVAATRMAMPRTEPVPQAVHTVASEPGSEEDPFASLDACVPTMTSLFSLEPSFGLIDGDWPHPLINDGVVTVRNRDSGVEVIVRAAGFILFQSEGEVEELGATTHRVTVRVGSASLDVPPEAVAPL